MQPNDVTEADRQILRVIDRVCMEIDLAKSPLQERPAILERAFLAFRADVRRAQREEDCRAVDALIEHDPTTCAYDPCGQCEHVGGLFDAEAAIRSLSLPEPPAKNGECEKCGGDPTLGVCRCWPAPPKPEPR